MLLFCHAYDAYFGCVIWVVDLCQTSGLELLCLVAFWWADYRHNDNVLLSFLWRKIFENICYL